MAQTHNLTRTKHSKAKIYRKRVKSSRCHLKTGVSCRRTTGCKTTKAGQRRAYCRKTLNTRIYSNRMKTSRCHLKTPKSCVRTRGCKTTKAGRRRAYCRKTVNNKI
jgi:hypothetical protein